MKVYFEDGTMKTLDLRNCTGYICDRIELEPVDLVQIARMQQEDPGRLTRILMQLASRPAENRVGYEQRMAQESVPAGEFYEYLIGENRRMKRDKRKSTTTIQKLRRKKKELEERARSQGKQLETWHKGEGVSDLVHEVRELKERLGERDDKIIHLTQEHDKLNDVVHDHNVALDVILGFKRQSRELQEEIMTLEAELLKCAPNLEIIDGLKRENETLNDIVSDQTIKFADLLNQLDEACGLAKDAEEDRDMWENRARDCRQWVSQTMRDKYREWK